MACAPPEHVGTRLYGALHEGFDFFQLTGMDQRADLGVGELRIPDLKRGNVLSHSVSEFIANLFVNEKARAGETHLSGVTVHQGASACSQLQIRIFEHDKGRLASQFQAARHQIARGFRCDVPGCRYGSGE